MTKKKTTKKTTHDTSTHTTPWAEKNKTAPAPDPRPADGFVRTFSGARLYLRREHAHHSDPVPLKDIELGLEREPRWSGQTSAAYTVEQHSIAVGLVAAWHPEPLTDSDDCGPIAVPQRPVSHRLRTLVGGLLHDAHKAVLRDIPKPVKAALGPGVAELEELVDGYIHQAVAKECVPFFTDPCSSARAGCSIATSRSGRRRRSRTRRTGAARSASATPSLRFEPSRGPGAATQAVW